MEIDTVRDGCILPLRLACLENIFDSVELLFWLTGMEVRVFWSIIVDNIAICDCGINKCIHLSTYFIKVNAHFTDGFEMCTSQFRHTNSLYLLSRVWIN